jgi:cell division protein FtsB
MSMARTGWQALAGFLHSVAFLATVGYFSYAAWQGEYGVLRRIETEAREAELGRALALLVAERERAENRVRRLSDAFLDLDLLDEQARSVLGLARPDEIVIR